MDKKRFKALLGAFYKRRLKGKEEALMQRWYDSFGEDRKDVPGLEDDTAKQQLEQELDAGIRSALWDKKTKQRSIMPFPWQRVAATITLAFLTAGFTWWLVLKNPRKLINAELGDFQTMRTVHTGTRQVKKLSLPDGSIVHVNAHSKLRIPQTFSEASRDVYLDEGEAFFEVMKDDSRPFAVHTEQIRVRVLGTAFNVNAYPQLGDISVAVQEGRIQVTDDHGLRRELARDEAIRYHKEDGSVRPAWVDISHLNSWISGRLYLEKASFAELALAMHNIYGVTLKSQDPKTADDQYNLIIRADRRLEETMDLICAIHKNHYRRKGNDLIIYP